MPDADPAGMPGANGRYRGLLVDYGGVLTSNLFDSFRLFCEQEGLEADTVMSRFREDRECRAVQRVVVGRRDGLVRTTNLSPLEPQAVECLR